MRKKWTCLGVVCLLLLLGACNTAPLPSVSAATPSPVVATPTPALVPAATPTPTPQTVLDMTGRNPLTGLPYAGAYEPVMVMINNDAAASRPQSGMAGADWVYECYIEGAGTRYLAVYNGEKPEKVGPVRSCRMYFARLSRAFDGVLIHIGGPSAGTPSVYAVFDQLGLRARLDGTKTDEYFWRTTDRKTPHNAYINAAEVTAGYYPKIGKPEPPKYLFGEGPVTGKAAEYIAMTLNTFTKVEYKYDKASGRYDRYENGKIDADKEDGRGVKCANVIVQHCKQTSFGTAEGHINVGVIGEGKATIFMAGQAVEATWKKESAKAHTQYMDASGQAIIFRAGATWVQVVKTDFTYTVKDKAP